MHILLSIGCNTYDYLPQLEGAEKDAKEVFELLCRPPGDYHKELSSLLLSPAHVEINEALSQVFPSGREIDVLTFYFAGHAGVKAGSFYLCVRDSDRERLSMTAFPIATLFAITNEIHPRQLNIVVDAWRRANPSLLLPVLLIFGEKLGLGRIWDLRVLDRTHAAFFIPDDYHDFGRKVIEKGMNYTRQIGFPICSVAAFSKEYERAMKGSFVPDIYGSFKEGAALCTVASLLFPDRLPVLLEWAVSKK